MEVIEFERRSWQHGVSYMREHPLEFTQLAARKLMQLWSPWPDAVTTGRAAGGAYRDLLSAIAYLPMLALACVGLVMSARTQWRRLLHLYAFMSVFIAPFAVFLPTMRYRLPLDFLLILFVSVPLAHLWAAWLGRRSAQLAQLRT